MCGDMIIWTHQPETSTLFIEGKGKMFDYQNEEKNYNPWYMHNYFYVSKIIVSNEATSRYYNILYCHEFMECII